MNCVNQRSYTAMISEQGTGTRQKPSSRTMDFAQLIRHAKAEPLSTQERPRAKSLGVIIRRENKIAAKSLVREQNLSVPSSMASHGRFTSENNPILVKNEPGQMSLEDTSSATAAPHAQDGLDISRLIYDEETALRDDQLEVTGEDFISPVSSQFSLEYGEEGCIACQMQGPGHSLIQADCAPDEDHSIKISLRSNDHQWVERIEAGLPFLRTHLQAQELHISQILLTKDDCLQPFLRREQMRPKIQPFMKLLQA